MTLDPLRTEGPYRFLEGMNALVLRRGPGFKSPRRLRFGDGGFNPQGNSSSLYSLPLMKSDAESTQSETLVAVHNVRPRGEHDQIQPRETFRTVEFEELRKKLLRGAISVSGPCALRARPFSRTPIGEVRRHSLRIELEFSGRQRK